MCTLLIINSKCQADPSRWRRVGSMKTCWAAFIVWIRRTCLGKCRCQNIPRPQSRVNISHLQEKRENAEESLPRLSPLRCFYPGSVCLSSVFQQQQHHNIFTTQSKGWYFRPSTETSGQVLERADRRANHKGSYYTCTYDFRILPWNTSRSCWSSSSGVWL